VRSIYSEEAAHPFYHHSILSPLFQLTLVSAVVVDSEEHSSLTMTVTISLPLSSTPSPDMSSPSSTAPSSPGLTAPSWHASGVYVPVHKRRQGMHSSASSPAMSTFELEPDTRRSTYTREALLQIARSPFVPLAPSSELLQAFPNIIRPHGHGIDQALMMSLSGMGPSKSFQKHGGGQYQQSEFRGKSQHGRSRSYGRNKGTSSPRFAHSSSDQSDFSSGSDSESNWRAH